MSNCCEDKWLHISSTFTSICLDSVSIIYYLTLVIYYLLSPVTVAEKQENHWELLVLYWITGLLKWIIWIYALCLYLLSWATLPSLCAYTCSQGLHTGPPTPTPGQEQPLTSLSSPILCKFSPWSLQLLPLIITVIFVHSLCRPQNL